MTLPLKVLGDRVLVKPDVLSNAPVQTDAGVVIATSMAAAVTGEDATKSVNRGTVIAVGHPRHPREADALEAAIWLQAYGDPTDNAQWQDTAGDKHCELADLLRDLVRREPCVTIGDDVLFAYDAGQQITLDDESYILLHEADLLAIVEPEVADG